MSYITNLLAGRNAYGRVGGNVANILAQHTSNGFRQNDPRLSNAGFMLRDNSMDENPGSHGGYTQYMGQDKWNSTGSRTLNGKIFHQIGDMFTDGRNVNDDDLKKLVKDPSKVIYDDEAGLITDDDNLLYRGAEDDTLDKLIKAGIMAGIGAGGLEALGVINGTGVAAGTTGTSAGAVPSSSSIVSGGAAGGSTAVGAGGGGGGFFGGATGGLKGGSFLNQIGTALGIPSGVTNGLNTGRQIFSIANLVNNLTGGGGSGRRSGSGGSGMNGKSFLDFLGTIGSGYQDNRNIQSYESQINNLLDRGDPFREQRKGYIDRLNALYNDPRAVENTPGYQFAKQQGLDAIASKRAARGSALSGNELAEMTKYASGLAEQTFNKERDVLMQMAGANFNPAAMAGAGIGAYGNIAQMQANRNAGVMNGLFGNNGSRTSGASALYKIFKNLWPDSDLSEDDVGLLLGGGEGDWGDFPDNWDLLGP